MSADDPRSPDSPVSAIDPAVSRLIFLMMLGLMAGGFVAYRMLSQPPPPAPPEVAKDPLLAQGRTIFLGRCATCHGNEGRGDGPIAGNLSGPPVGDLTDDRWKHGDRPEQVLAVIAKGVPNTRMDGWSHVLDPPEVRSVAAYVYFLAKRPVPDELRKPESSSPRARSSRAFDEPQPNGAASVSERPARSESGPSRSLTVAAHRIQSAAPTAFVFVALTRTAPRDRAG